MIPNKVFSRIVHGFVLFVCFLFMWQNFFIIMKLQSPLLIRMIFQRPPLFNNHLFFRGIVFYNCSFSKLSAMFLHVFWNKVAVRTTQKRMCHYTFSSVWVLTIEKKKQIHLFNAVTKYSWRKKQNYPFYFSLFFLFFYFFGGGGGDWN